MSSLLLMTCDGQLEREQNMQDLFFVVNLASSFLDVTVDHCLC